MRTPSEVRLRQYKGGFLSAINMNDEFFKQLFVTNLQTKRKMRSSF